MSSEKKLLLSDATLRDGNHAVSHQLNSQQIAAYCQAADLAGVPIVEVGHGNGLGGSSLLVGEAATDDIAMLTIARENLKSSKLGIHVIPGFATIERDLKPALECGVDVVRVAAHCTEADITQRHIEYCVNESKTVFGVLMMSHMATKETLAEEVRKMEAYGAEAVILMDSAGYFLPSDVTERISYLLEKANIPIGFHAHNNLGMAIANSVAAIEAGASIVDGCARGFGAGAGNAQLETLVAVLHRMNYQTGVDLYRLLDACDLAEEKLLKSIPTVSSVSIVSGLSGVFSGFLKPVQRISEQFEVDPRDVFSELGKRRVVAGQEDLIVEVAMELSKESE